MNIGLTWKALRPATVVLGGFSGELSEGGLAQRVKEELISEGARGLSVSIRKQGSIAKDPSGKAPFVRALRRQQAVVGPTPHALRTMGWFDSACGTGAIKENGGCSSLART